MNGGEGLVEVIVKLTAEAAASANAQRRALEECAARTGVPLRPLHPSTTDPELASYYSARVEAAAAPSVAERLRACEGVDGAYAKPRGEAP